MLNAAERTGWSTYLGCCWAYMQHLKKRQAFLQLRLPMCIFWCCPASCSHPTCPTGRSSQGEHPQCGEACKGGREGVGSASPRGVPRVHLGGGGNHPLDAMYHGPYHMLVREQMKLLLGDRGLLDVDLCGPSEATHGC